MPKTPDENPNGKFKRFVDAAKERGVEKDMAEHAFREIAASQSTKAKPK